MATYCTVADFSEAVPFFVIDDAASLEEYIKLAERDIDKALGPGGRDQTTGLKLAPARLSEYRTKALARAVAYQAEYRMVKGENFFINFRPESQSGPDGSISGREPFIAPKASQELTFGDLYRLVTGRGRRGSLYDLPNQNIDQEPW